jgi:gamma-glutamyltranspeptidase/glutathione hydrolase
MGGDSQPQILLQVLARALLAGHSPADAVSAGRWSLGVGFGIWDEGAPAAVLVEGHAPGPWDDGLRHRGHRVTRLPPWDGAFGHTQLLVIGAGHLAGAADPRARGGSAAGW